MNYYQEFGVHPGASTEEIRQAYKTLARLLHPDGHSDEVLRAAAERQMKRLNEILAILTNPQKRREYDESLGGAKPLRIRQAPPPRAVVIRPPLGGWCAEAVVRNWFWILLTIAGLGMATIWRLTPENATMTETAPVPASTPRAPASASSTRRHEANFPRTAPASPAEESTIEVPPYAVGTPPLLPESRSMPAPQRPAPAPAHPAERTSTAQAGGSASPRIEPQEPAFAGSWIYAPLSGDGPQGRYPALYMECLLKQTGGKITGDYRARYRVPDRAISPDVAFHIRGETPAGNSGTMEWAAADGAQGMLQLTLQAPGLLRVAWWTTRPGRRPSMSSGEGILIRQQTP
jgi:hypothetical protein